MQQQGFDIDMELTYDIYLDFLDSTHAELFHDLYVYVPAYPAASQSDNMTEELTVSTSTGTLRIRHTCLPGWACIPIGVAIVAL